MAIDKLYICRVFKLVRIKEKHKETIMARAKNTQFYMFNMSKIEEIFSLLLADGLEVD